MIQAASATEIVLVLYVMVTILLGVTSGLTFMVAGLIRRVRRVERALEAYAQDKFSPWPDRSCRDFENVSPQSLRPRTTILPR